MKTATVSNKVRSKAKTIMAVISRIEDFEREFERESKRKLEVLTADLERLENRATIADLVGCMPESIRPKLIKINKPGRELALLQTKKNPNRALLVWTDGNGGTRWSIRLGHPRISRSFYLPCGCCPTDTYGREKEAPTKDSESPEYQAWERKCALELVSSIVEECTKNSITCILVRHADIWVQRFGYMSGVEIAEGSSQLELEQEL